MGEKIQLYMEDWMKNAGIVGLSNILKNSGDSVIFHENYVEFESEFLIDFEEKYFNYLIDKYKDVISINKILSFEKFIIYHEENNFQKFNKDSLEQLNNYIGDIAKRYVKSASYKSAYELIDSPIDLLAIEKELKKISLKNKQNIEDIMPEIKMQINLIKDIISFMKQEEAYKYIGGKNIIYTVIRNAWNGVSFLNPQTKEKDMYKDYKAYFVEPVIEYQNLDKSKFKYPCFSCGREIKDLKNDLSFLNSTGFDVSRKSSHVWDFQNDIAICPICKLVYSCIPAGINYLYNKGIYINDSSSVENAININQKIYMEIYKQNGVEKKLTYKALVKSIQEQFNDKLKYELADIQLVRYEEEKYKFNILSRKSLIIIKESQKDLDNLLKAGFKEINTYFNVYELVIDRLLNNQNMFTLVQKLLHYKLSQPKDSYYNSYHILKILNINIRFLKEVGYMKESDKDIVKLGNNAGFFLRKQYKDKGSVDKLTGISYRLLNSLKTNNINSFMDTVLNCYLYAKESVPKIIVDSLKDEEQFKTIGYAFVAGLIEGKVNEDKGGQKDE